jgi:hypothetical protein
VLYLVQPASAPAGSGKNLVLNIVFSAALGTARYSSGVHLKTLIATIVLYPVQPAILPAGFNEFLVLKQFLMLHSVQPAISLIHI